MLPVTLFTVLALLLLLGVWTAWDYRQERLNYKLIEGTANLALMLDNYAANNDGKYPADLKQFVAERNIELADNPYRSGKLKIHEPDDPWEPGGIVYIGAGPVLKEGASLKEFEDSKSMAPDEVITYILLAYSPRVVTPVQLDADKLRTKLSDAAIGCCSYPKPVVQALTEGTWPERVEYDQVEFEIMAGEFFERTSQP